MEYAMNWLIGGILFWPVACMIGRRMRVTRGGVPQVPLNRHVHDFPNVDPGFVARKWFRFYAFGSSTVAGFIFARAITDPTRRTSNQWYNRPDLKPYPAMVAQPERDITRETMERDLYGKGSEGKKSPIYRYFFPRDADFTIKENPYTNANREDIWDHRKAQYPTYGNNFGAHHQ